ncbi:hypothetical protein RE6C_00885 [Rhodopirellula europaea 6C]|uniref:Uncharacterized protein n=1 Tax=Rhodopirellula europaea 6C TaxID=1263867 RepID=M2B867_9BACT|nr:hypothetical protein RE6C_00885 [Rhodopirellula europaea 6C]
MKLKVLNSDPPDWMPVLVGLKISQPSVEVADSVGFTKACVEVDETPE